MVALQILSKVIATKSLSIIEDNSLTRDYFVEYQDEFDFIINHYQKYKNIPDAATFLDKFPDLELVEVTESDRYLVETIKEEYLYYRSVPIVQKSADLLKEDANKAAEYLLSQVSNLTPSYGITGVDIVSQANIRYEQYKERKNNPNAWSYTTGFQELDELIGGIQAEEEVIAIIARVNEGKSWILEKICSHVWQLGNNIGYISPEMGDTNVGYRFDTLTQHFSNKDLMWGKDDLDEAQYAQYINTLSQNNHSFIVSTPQDFENEVTVTKIKKWVQKYHLKLIGIDGITYLTDERAKRGDTMASQLSHISQDLHLLSMELKIPVLIVAQANRNAAFMEEDEESTPGLETIQHSDGISQAATKVISIRQLKRENIIRLEIKKQRSGVVNKRLDYAWNPNTGEFRFIPSDGDARSARRSTETKNIQKERKKTDKREAF